MQRAGIKKLDALKRRCEARLNLKYVGVYREGRTCDENCICVARKSEDIHAARQRFGKLDARMLAQRAWPRSTGCRARRKSRQIARLA